MKIGFSGTRDGMTAAQLDALTAMLNQLHASVGITEAHHGCCVGADAQFAFAVACDVKGTEDKLIQVHAYPCNLTGWTDYGALRATDVKYDVAPPLTRNRAIVKAVDLLIAAPKGPEEVRSGTWSTVRNCVLHKKPVRIVWPDGTVEER